MLHVKSRSIKPLQQRRQQNSALCSRGGEKDDDGDRVTAAASSATGSGAPSPGCSLLVGVGQVGRFPDHLPDQIMPLPPAHARAPALDRGGRGGGVGQAGGRGQGRSTLNSV